MKRSRPRHLPPSSKGTNCQSRPPVSGVILFMAVVAAVLLTGAGILDSRSEYSETLGDKCFSKRARLEYVFPFYRLGCWLGEEPQDSTDINTHLRECQELSKELNSQYSVEISDQEVSCVIDVDSGSYRVWFKGSELRGALRGIRIDRNIKVYPEYSKCVGPRRENISLNESVKIMEKCRKETGFK